eukprot:486305-Pelagomonas_calceolata.AAC.1
MLEVQLHTQLPHLTCTETIYTRQVKLHLHSHLRAAAQSAVWTNWPLPCAAAAAAAAAAGMGFQGAFHSQLLTPLRRFGYKGKRSIKFGYCFISASSQHNLSAKPVRIQPAALSSQCSNMKRSNGEPEPVLFRATV